MAAIDDVAAGINALNTSIPKLLAALTTEGNGQSAAAAELADVNTKLAVVAKVLTAINASVDGALNPPAADPTAAPQSDPNATVAQPPTTDAPAAPAGSVLS